MKTPLTYGALLALIGALVTFGCFFAGLHDSVDTLKTAQWITSLVGLVATVVCLLLAMRAQRAELAPDRPWGYGPALGVGVLTGLWAAIIGAAVMYVYVSVINPQYSELIYQARVASLQAKNLPPEAVENTSAMMRRFDTPIVLTLSQLIGSFVGNVILALIVAIFVRRPRAEMTPAPESPVPPPI